MKNYLSLLLISLISMFIHGYQFAVSDQEIFIPYILKSANPSLFPGDALFNQSSANLSIFYPLIGITTKFIDIQVVFFAGYLIFQFAFFAGIYRLSKVLLKNENLALFSLLPFLLPKFIGGTATQTFDLFFGYRSVGLIFFIFYLSYLFEKKYLKSLILASLGFLFHPLSFVPNIIIIPVLFVLDSKSKTQNILKIILLSVFVGTLAYIILGYNYFYDVLSSNQTWYKIIKLRDDYVLASTWSLSGWAAFFLYPVLIFLLSPNISKETKKTIQVIAMVTLFIFLINAILLDVLKLPGFAQFQLVRSIAPLAYVGLALLPLLLTFKNKILRISGYLAFISLSLNLFYVFLMATVIFSTSLYLVKNKKNNIPSSKTFLLISVLIVLIYVFSNLQSYTNINSKFQFPKKEDDWILLQKWMNENTTVTDKVLIPPEQTGFRIFSKRSILGDIKDGAVVIYNRKYAHYWQKLMVDLGNYNSYEDADFLRLKDQYNFTYLVSPIGGNLNFQVVYRNNTFNLYKL